MQTSFLHHLLFVFGTPPSWSKIESEGLFKHKKSPQLIRVEAISFLIKKEGVSLKNQRQPSEIRHQYPYFSLVKDHYYIQL